MDILKKMFKPKEQEGPQKDTDSTTKDEFRKPQWFEEVETDDELFDDDRKFAFQVFTNPIELQKHFERQMRQVLEVMTEFENDKDGLKVDKNLKEEFLKPGFEDNVFKEKEKNGKIFIDTDLDGEIYADDLHSLIQRLAPTDPHATILPSNESKASKMRPKKKKLSDEETILGRIHGTIKDEESRARVPRLRPDILTPMTPMLPRSVTPFGGVFEGTYQGPKMFSQSVVTKTVRKPDGSYETTKVTQDSTGNRTTTVTRTVDGKSETVTTYDNAHGSGTIKQDSNKEAAEISACSDRNIYVTKEGYAVPRNLW